jgi:hypothetical protein
MRQEATDKRQSGCIGDGFCRMTLLSSWESRLLIRVAMAETPSRADAVPEAPMKTGGCQKSASRRANANGDVPSRAEGEERRRANKCHPSLQQVHGEARKRLREAPDFLPQAKSLHSCSLRNWVAKSFAMTRLGARHW